MKKRVFPILCILVLACCGGLFAQSDPTAAMPFISNLKAESSNNLIKLTWVDSPAAPGQVAIFRSARPFGRTIAPNSRPIFVPYGVQEYIDDVDTLEIIYYFIAATSAAGRLYINIIPDVNSVSVNLRAAAEAAARRTASPADPGQPAQPTQPAGPGQLAQSGQLTQPGEMPAIPLPLLDILNLKAEQHFDRVVVSYYTASSKTVVLYRSTHPVRQLHDLLTAVIVHTGIANPFTDYPPTGQPWYYTAVYEDELATGSARIVPESNTTTDAVMLSGAQGPQDMFRAAPLPYLTVLNAVPDSDVFWALPNRVPLTDETLKVLDEADPQPKAPLELKRPRVFAVDLQPPESGEESALIHIVQESFKSHDWDSARAGLQQYLSQHRAQDVEARARFYLGQTFYFSGMFREALFEFLAVKPFHPAEANIWIAAVLEAMVH